MNVRYRAVGELSRSRRVLKTVEYNKIYASVTQLVGLMIKIIFNVNAHLSLLSIANRYILLQTFLKVYTVEKHVKLFNIRVLHSVVFNLLTKLCIV